MLPYFVAILGLLILNITRSDKRFEIRFINFIILLYIAIFMCGGYMCGSDWRQYELLYQDGDYSIFEPGYFTISNLFKSIGFNFWEYCIILKFICLIIFYKVVIKYCKINTYLALIFLFSFYGIYLFIDAPLRNLCSISIFLYSILIFEKHPKIAIVLPAVGILFHSSSVIGYLFYALYYISKRYPIKNWVFVTIYIIAIIISFQGFFIANLVNDTAIGQLLFAEKLTRYVDNGFAAQSTVSNANSAGQLIKILFFFIVIFYRTKIEKLNNGKIIFIGAMIYFILSKIAAAMDVLMRFDCYYSVFYAIVMCLLITVVNYRKIYKTFFILYAVLICAATLATDYRFVPYTNYVSYLIFHDRMPTYNERSRYNIINSPYK